jgi:hypothetical protein
MSNQVRALLSANSSSDTSSILELNANDLQSYPGSGTTWTNTAKPGTSATLINGPVFNSSGYKFFSFDGINDRATINDSTGLFAFKTADDFTIKWWHKCNQPTEFDFFIDAGNQKWAIQSGQTLNTVIWVERTNIIASRGAAGIYDNTWRMLTFTKTASTMRAYMDTTQIGAAWTSTLNLTNAEVTNLNIADWQTGAGYALAAGISQVSIFKRALTAGEIAAEFNSVKTTFGI